MKNITLSVSLLAIMAAISAPAWGQDALDTTQIPAAELDRFEAAQDGLDIDTITVVGTRLSRGASSEPVTVFDSTDIANRGISSVDELLRSLPANNSGLSASNPGGIAGRRVSNRSNPAVDNFSGGTVANLRGLGAGSTLVLVDGRRRAGEGVVSGDFLDISGIPIDSIDRIEILTAGASAIYGADAVAGVINIVLKKDYSGTTVSARGEYSESGGHKYRLSGTHGTNWDGGNLTVSGAYEKNEAVSARKFGITTLDFRNQGGTDFSSLTSPNGVFTFDPEFFIPTMGDPFVQSGYELPSGFGSVDMFTPLGDLNLVSRDSLQEILPNKLTPEAELFSVNASLKQDINSDVFKSFSLDVNYSRRETVTDVGDPEISQGGFGLAFSNFGSPFLDGFFPRNDVQFTRSLSAEAAAGLIPNNSFETTGDDWGITAGLQGEFGSGWNWDATASYSQNNDTSIITTLDINTLFAGVFDFETFMPLVPAFNIIRNDFLTNSDAEAALRSAVTQRDVEGESSLITLQGVVRKEFWDGREIGGLSTAFGVEYRSEDLFTISNSVSDIRNETVGADLDASRESLALFGELSLPLSNTFTVNAAARYEDVTNKGNSSSPEDSLAAFIATGGASQFDNPVDFTPFEVSNDGFSPRLGAAWNPTDTVKLRATIGRSFRAPNPNEVGAPARAFGAFGVVDPQTGGFFAPDVPTIGGGNRAIKPEIADTRNLGISFTPEILGANMFFSADYWNIDYRDRVADAGQFSGNPFAFPPEAANEAIIVRDSAGNPRYLIGSAINTANEELAGLDLVVSMDRDFGKLNLVSDFRAALQTKRELKIQSSDPFDDRLGLDQPETTWVWSNQFSYDKASLAVNLRYTGDYEQSFGDFGTGPSEIDSFLTTDVQLGYDLPWGRATKVRVGVNNLFDTDPPFANRGNGFDESFYDVRRRVMYLDLSTTF